MYFWIVLILVCVYSLGFVIGHISCKRELLKKNTVGTLRVDRSIPEEEPYLFLELNKGVGDISQKEYVILNVDLNSYISQN